MDVLTKPDPLAKLFIPHDTSIREIAEFLLPYCRIDREKQQVRFFTDRWILIECKILLYLMCLRVMDFKQEREGISASPSEIAEGINAIGGSVRPKIRQLFEARLISREGNEEDGRKSLYSVPTGRIREVMKYIPAATRNID